MNAENATEEHNSMVLLPAPRRVSYQYSRIIYKGPNELVERRPFELGATLIASLRSCRSKQQWISKLQL